VGLREILSISGDVERSAAYSPQSCHSGLPDIGARIFLKLRTLVLRYALRKIPFFSIFLSNLRKIKLI